MISDLDLEELKMSSLSVADKNYWRNYQEELKTRLKTHYIFVLLPYFIGEQVSHSVGFLLDQMITKPLGWPTALLRLEREAEFHSWCRRVGFGF